MTAARKPKKEKKKGGGGQRLANYRKGDSAERLAEFILGTFAFTTAVPRQEDIGLDFHCVLCVPADGGILRAGPFFCVQVKAKGGAFEYGTDAAISWISEQDNPLFLCTVDRTNLTCSIYATLNLLNAVLLHPNQELVLLPDVPIDYENVPVKFHEQSKVVQVPLGQPILSFSASEAVSNEWPAKCYEVMRPWIELDRDNIVRHRSNIHIVRSPTSWRTNETFIGRCDYREWVYTSPDNLPYAVGNLVRACGALGRVVESDVERRDDPDWRERIDAASRLETLLLQYIPPRPA